MSNAGAEETDLLQPIESSSTAQQQPLSSAELLALPAYKLTAELIQASLQPVSDSEAIQACIHLLSKDDLSDTQLVGNIIEQGLFRGEPTFRKVEEAVSQSSSSGGPHDRERLEPLRTQVNEVLEERFDEDQRSLVRDYALLAQYKSRLETYRLFAPSSEAGPSTPRRGEHGAPEDAKEGEVEGTMEIDDPWSENTEEETTQIDDPWETNSVKSAGSASRQPTEPDITNLDAQDDDDQDQPDGIPPISLSSFLSSPPPDSAVSFASAAAIHALKIVYSRHGSELWPYRFGILEGFPPWVSPVDLKEISLLPSVSDDGLETSPQLLGSIPSDAITQILLPVHPITTTIRTSAKRQTADQLKEWYTSRINHIDTFGLLDLQLAWVQHGAALGIPGLDALGEDLSLLSRLVYDARLSPLQQGEWSLATWRSATPTTIINAYLSNATQNSIVNDIRRLVLPYLYVLESRAERAGEETLAKELVETHVHDILLGLSLHLALPVFEASKATTPTAERIIKSDLTVARLALACLYGSNTRDAWNVMSAIFECLPVWDVSGGDPESDKEATSTTLDSIALFVRPTRAGAHPPTAKDLFLFFSPLPFASLSRALDILDVHLESGEILARWDTPVQLRFLLQSARDKSEQKELAEKMVRRQVAGGAGASATAGEQRWQALWGDMRKLNGGGDALLRGAFGVLSVGEMLEIYLGGVLASGKFDIARRVIRRLEGEVEGGIPPDMLEKAVLATSREFYENAESGNIHTGEMKLAYDCLAVAPPSPAITRERDFIEATSRLTTFSLPSPSGTGTLSPLEIRHSKSKLKLIEQVLQSSNDAYRHPDLILELAEKLGFHDAPSRIRVIAMLSASARRNEDYEGAYAHCQEMFHLRLPSAKPAKGNVAAADESVEGDGDVEGVVWKELLALGSQVDYHDTTKKMTLLGQAVERCPSGEVPSVLAVWRKVEAGQMKLTDAAKRRRERGLRSDPGGGRGVGGSKRSSVISNTSQPGGGGTGASMPEERVLGSRTAARAARLAMGFAGNRFNLRDTAAGGVAPRSPSVHAPSPVIDAGGDGWGRASPRSSTEGDRPSFGAMFEGAGVKAGTAEAERVRQQARKALVRGVGWLLGADEKELGEE